MIVCVSSVVDETLIDPVGHVLSWIEAVSGRDLVDIETVVQTLMRDLCTNLGEQLMRISSNADLRKILTELACFISSHKDWGGARITDSRMLMTADQIRNPQRLFMTSQEQWGSGRPATRKSDCVFIAKGSRCPLLLRPVHRLAIDDAKEESPSYQFVGLCYVDGIMIGEAVNADTEWQTIRLL